MVLESGDKDLIAALQVGSTVGLSYEIDCLGRAAREDDLARRACVQKPAHALARSFERCGGILAQGVYAAMHIGVQLSLVVIHRRDDLDRPLRGCRVVEVRERVAMYQTL